MRYLAVGGIAFGVDFAVLVLGTDLLGWHYLWGAVAGFVAGLWTNYALSVSWVFDDRSLSNWQFEFLLFAIIGIGGLVLTGFLMWAGTDVLNVDYRIAKIATVFVVTVWNFGLRRMLLFGGLPA